MTHNSGLRNWHKMTNLLIDRILNMARIYIVYGALTGTLGQMQKMFASNKLSQIFNNFNFNKIYFFLRSWYDEVKQYVWNVEPKASFKAAQFSQMVWKDTKELGVGMGRTKNGKVIVVAGYWPRGNIIGQFLHNIKRSN
jgi:hypothetical protein